MITVLFKCLNISMITKMLKKIKFLKITYNYETLNNVFKKITKNLNLKYLKNKL